jgi:fucose-1-phosphate guanylyltransferase
MHAMHVLEQQYGWEILRQKRILLIHAGGYSQRTPTTSCLGKISTSIPRGEIRALEKIKLEMFIFQVGQPMIY